MDRFVREFGRGRDHGCAPCGIEDLARRHGRAAAGEEMTRADAAVERGAEGLQRLSRRAAHAGGLRAKIAPSLAEDAAFLRKLKPSLMVARARGEAPTDQVPGEPVVTPSGPQHGKRPKQNGGPSPLLIVVAAGAAGVLLAKLIDWRGHAHPRD